MKIYDLQFTNGKQCRHIVPQPQDTEEEELRITQAIFCGRLASMTRIIAPPPEKLPWKRMANDRWELNLFELKRAGIGSEKEFILTWPGGILSSKDKDAISAAVRSNWHLGC